MKQTICLLVVFSVLAISANAQDEGNITKRDRIGLDKGIFLGLGPSFTFGKNIGDYSTGLNVEVGYISRLNRVVSIGGSLSYMSFKYDPEKTGVNNSFISDEMYFDNTSYYDYWLAMYVDFKGGDMTLVSLAANLKFNLVPVMDNSTISVYAFAKPFITMSSRTQVKGTSYLFAVYDYDFDELYSEEEILDGAYSAVQVPWEAGDPTWESIGVNISDKLDKDSRITGGIFVGPGIEFFPARKVSFYAQAAFGYTFPVSFVSTKKYEGNSLDAMDEEFPIIEQGFPSINLQFGISLNF